MGSVKTTNSWANPALDEARDLARVGMEDRDKDLRATIYEALGRANERELRIVYNFLKTLTK